MNKLSKAAALNRDLGQRIIPVSGKKSLVKWSRYIDRDMPGDQLEMWLGKPQCTGIAVILGEPSEGLICRDFDIKGAYEAWAEAHPAFSKILPTAKTAKGYHVFIYVKEFLKTKVMGDGELRGNGGYVLLPPSEHPTGPDYVWVRDFTEGECGQVDLAETGLDQQWGGSSSKGETCTQSNQRTKSNQEHQQ